MPKTHRLLQTTSGTFPWAWGRQFAHSIGRAADTIFGGWQTTGIVRWTSGFPFPVQNGPNFPTNWDIQGFATQIAKVSTAKGKLQQRFANPAAVLATYDFTLPGGSGTRNPLRGDGYFDIDAGLSKTLSLTDRYHLKLGIEVFNISNSVRFDAQSVSANLGHQAQFGEATSTDTTERRAQFFGRFEF